MVRLWFKVAAFDVDISTSENLAFDSQLLCLVSQYEGKFSCKKMLVLLLASTSHVAYSTYI